MTRNRFLFTIVLCGLVLTGMPVQAQQIAKGRIYCDKNANGRHDRGEQFLQGVAVTNGTDVVQTDEKGRYNLPVNGEATIAVIKPTGYRTPLDRYNRPQFYYYHKPQGTPVRKAYKGIAPTGKLPSSIDFGLVPQEEPDAFQALVFGDPQPHYMDHIRYFSKAIVSEQFDRVRRKHPGNHHIQKRRLSFCYDISKASLTGKKFAESRKRAADFMADCVDAFTHISVYKKNIFAGVRKRLCNVKRNGTFTVTWKYTCHGYTSDTAAAEQNVCA